MTDATSSLRRTLRASSLGLAALLLGVAACAGGSGSPDPSASTPPAPIRTGLVGIAVPGTVLAFGTPQSLAADLDAIAETGAEWVRFDIPWTHVSWQPGQYDWRPYDAVVDAARARGLRILGVLGTLAPHIRPPGTGWQQGPTGPEQRAAFVSYAREAASRYAGRVEAWEVWNEPNLDQSWAPTPNVAEYAALLVATSEAVRPVCGGCRIIAGGTGGAQPNSPDLDTLTWFRRLYATPAPRSVDASAVHPYSDMRNGAAGEMSLVPQIRSIMDAAGYSEQPIWGTEIGAPTGGTNSASESAAVTLMWQGNDAWVAMAPSAKTGPLFWYTLRDSDDPTREGHFGVMRRDGSRKPAFDEFVRITRTIRR